MRSIVPRRFACGLGWPLLETTAGLQIIVLLPRNARRKGHHEGRAEIPAALARSLQAREPAVARGGGRRGRQD
jgi:hypothetical protein